MQSLKEILKMLWLWLGPGNNRQNIIPTHLSVSIKRNLYFLRVSWVLLDFYTMRISVLYKIFCINYLNSPLCTLRVLSWVNLRVSFWAETWYSQELRFPWDSILKDYTLFQYDGKKYQSCKRKYLRWKHLWIMTHNKASTWFSFYFEVSPKVTVTSIWPEYSDNKHKWNREKDSEKVHLSPN